MTFGERFDERPPLTSEQKIEMLEASFRYVCNIRDEAIRHMMYWKHLHNDMEKSIKVACEGTGCKTVEELRKKADWAMNIACDEGFYGMKNYYEARLSNEKV